MTDSSKKYLFCLNPDSDNKVSRCPFCQKATFKRKFPLVIHIDKSAGLLNLGYTCKYCAKCECIVADKYGLESELTIIFEKQDPSCIGNEYMVLGTSDKTYWKQQVKKTNSKSTKPFQITEFKEMYNLGSVG